jgi:hypothetical protein
MPPFAAGWASGRQEASAHAVRRQLRVSFSLPLA